MDSKRRTALDLVQENAKNQQERERRVPLYKEGSEANHLASRPHLTATLGAIPVPCITRLILTYYELGQAFAPT
jgi:hypothetical protein